MSAVANGDASGRGPRQWYDRPMPLDWKASAAEWDWYCYRTKGSFAQQSKQAGQAKAAQTKLGPG